MHQALRQRTEDDVRLLNEAISALETGPANGAGPQKAVEELRQLRRRKEESLEAGS
jgi:hypothetical protein